MTLPHQFELLAAIDHWYALATAEMARAEIDAAAGHATNGHLARAECYRNTARALRLELETGRAFCSCCLRDDQWLGGSSTITTGDVTRAYDVRVIGPDGSDTIHELRATCLSEALTMAEREYPAVAFGICSGDFELARAEGIRFDTATGVLNG
jgi:hypothetical protein